MQSEGEPSREPYGAGCCSCRCACRAPALSRYTRFLCAACWTLHLNGDDAHAPMFENWNKDSRPLLGQDR